MACKLNGIYFALILSYYTSCYRLESTINIISKCSNSSPPLFCGTFTTISATDTSFLLNKLEISNPIYVNILVHGHTSSQTYKGYLPTWTHCLCTAKSSNYKHLSAGLLCLILLAAHFIY